MMYNGLNLLIDLSIAGVCVWLGYKAGYANGYIKGLKEGRDELMEQLFFIE